jgi:hypothetical protein
MQTVDTLVALPSESETIIINPRKRSPSWGSHAPLVMATFPTASDRRPLSNCADVRDVYGQCLETHSSDNICKTAASYFSICMRSTGKE